jgi:hypothetical protein
MNIKQSDGEIKATYSAVWVAQHAIRRVMCDLDTALWIVMKLLRSLCFLWSGRTLLNKVAVRAHARSVQSTGGAGLKSKKRSTSRRIQSALNEF